MTVRRHARPVALAAATYLGLTIAYSWPLARHLANGVPHDPYDPLLNTWILWWSTKAIPLTAHWWNAPIFLPAVGTLAFSEDLLGLCPMSAPIIATTHNALLGYNVSLLASFVLCGLGAYFLAYSLTGRHDASFVAGLAFAFAPYRVAQLPHLQVLSSYWTPVCLAALHRYTTEPRTKWATLAAAAWVMQALACGYYLFFLSVLVGLWVAWFAVGRWSMRQIFTFAWALAVGAGLLAPVLVGYDHILRDTYGFSRGIGEIRSFSADVGSLLDASPDLRLWGWLHVVHTPEGQLFPGLTITALVIILVTIARPFQARAGTTGALTGLRWGLGGALVVLTTAAAMPMIYGRWRLSIGGERLVSISRPDEPATLALIVGLAWLATLPAVRDAVRRRSQLGFYTVAAAAMWLFSLGPDPAAFGRPTINRAPYGWLMRLPGIDGLRVPARFWMMALVCLSVLAALAVHRFRGRARRTVVIVAAIGLLLDGWPRFVVLPAPEYRAAPPGVVARLDLPSNDDLDATSLYEQTFERVPLYNGYSGYVPPQQYAMREMLERHDPRILQALTAAGDLGITIDRAADTDGAYRRFVMSYPGATQVETHPGWSSYRLPSSNGGDPVPEEHGRPLSIQALTASSSQPNAARVIDGSLKTRWSGGPQQSAANFTIELDKPSAVGQLVTDLGEFWTDFPQRLRIEVSPDGIRWETIFFGDTMLQAYYGAIRHPRQIPLVFPVGRPNVRFLRLTQLGWGAHDWSIAEVRVLR